ncbi:MAG TPA: tRNA (adenosine(37)-N6)-threonylcarbamoyltransferase complex transferase subunit TsaD [Deltaproteobacteria bacterium]|nr:tRNA (adenosine(37)-N6)-threonylcarbamoyltransferase complex transferase subunit TsaD [Deltaproteobacteria bacterium]HCP47084.1 tRNA (adenosine(37)-N6)-threonylcarbamoyltransferase complex transferase subunit TsaD [Deltaproteobacteria bacterium]
MLFPLLAIETSCDETAAAVMGPEGQLLSSVVHSQIDDHALFGGVVPELASRCHVEAIRGVVDRALSDAGCSIEDLGCVAATRGPGLVGSLLVGLSYAQGLAAARDLPLLGINHLEGHLLAPFVGSPEPPFPFLALVVSGGHTELVIARGLGDYEVVGQTRDDAAGEAFDKGARLLGLGYPGGVVIDRLSQQGDAACYALPRGMAKRPGFDFSFSGLKTAVWKHVQANGVPQGSDQNDFCASLQEAIVDALLLKTRKAAREWAMSDIVVTGGVAANSRLRARFQEVADEEGWTLHRPVMSLCTDNAGMIGYVAALRASRGERHSLSTAVCPGLALGPDKPPTPLPGALLESGPSAEVPERG